MNVTHIAGLDVLVEGRYLRQLCAWCGHTLLDYDLQLTAVPLGQGPPSPWAVGAFVAVDGPVSSALLEAGSPLPPDFCGWASLADPDDVSPLHRGDASPPAAAEHDASSGPGEDPSATAGVLSSAWKGDRCESCQTAIIWRKHVGTARPAPINARPDEAGNVVLVDPDRYLVLGRADLAAPVPDGQIRHTNHFATCPQAGGHHRGH